MSQMSNEELKKIRTETLDYTVTKMAEKIGVPRADYRKFESGDLELPSDIGETVDDVVAEFMSGGDAPKKKVPKKEAPKKELVPKKDVEEEKEPAPEVEKADEAEPAPEVKKKPKEKPKEVLKKSPEPAAKGPAATSDTTPMGDIVSVLLAGKKITITISLD